ncbi:hypothetical protein EJB05_26031, partial [Eragrostis curvula]
MARSSAHKLRAAAHRLALLLCIFCAVAAGQVITRSIPAFNASTDNQYYIVLTKYGFDIERIFSSYDNFKTYAGSKTSKGFVFVLNGVNFWRSGVEASFSTSFTLVAGAAPVSFVVSMAHLTNASMAPRGPDLTNARAAGLAFVEVSGLATGFSCLSDAGLNVTVSPTGAGGRAVWVDYSAAVQRLCVYVTRAGEPKPANYLLNISMPHGVEGNCTSATAPVGFFAAKVGDVMVGVRDWNLTVDLNLPVDHSKGPNTLVVVLSAVLGSVAAIAISTTALYFYFNSKYRRWSKEQVKLAKVMRGLPGVPVEIEFGDIKRATKNFHDTMKLGKGGFGAVYRCTLPAAASRTGEAMEVAVKKFTQEVEDQRYDDFLAEVSIINRLRHRNIVPLVENGTSSGSYEFAALYKREVPNDWWSYNKGVPVLVYEYMTNGSLDQHLFRRGGRDNNHDPRDSTMSHWGTRYNIVRDIATGLHYVHHEHEPMVLHRDIKTSNIMLDSTFRARLGDFGIASTVAANKSYVTGLAGTFGYIGPDYAMSGKATRQTDIYAFGVLILEVVTGKKNTDVQPDDAHITDWVWRLHRHGMLLQAVDSMLTVGDKPDEAIWIDEVERLLLLGLACTNPNPSNRLSMVEVVQIINKLVPTPDVPLERPAFVWPPEDWRTCNSMYSTAMSDWESSSTNTMDLALLSRDQPPSATTGDKPLLIVTLGV